MFNTGRSLERGVCLSSHTVIFVQFGINLKSSSDFRESLVTFENLRVILENLRKSSGDLRHSSVIFGSLRVNFDNFRNTSDDLRKPLVFSMLLRTNFGNLH